jgi:predicted MFS family arabinose efflux permease
MIWVLCGNLNSNMFRLSKAAVWRKTFIHIYVYMYMHIFVNICKFPVRSIRRNRLHQNAWIEFRVLRRRCVLHVLYAMYFMYATYCTVCTYVEYIQYVQCVLYVLYV